MKKLLAVLILVIATFSLVFIRPATAVTLVSGAKVFTVNCAACHMGGRNVVAAAKTLKQEALEKYGMNSVEAIVHQVQNGKNAMLAFKGHLNDGQIEAVANCVLEQASKGWSRTL